MNKLSILQVAGFTAEILAFIMTGYFLALGGYIRAAICLIVAMALALGVGVIISKLAIQKYKEVNKNEIPPA